MDINKLLEKIEILEKGYTLLQNESSLPLYANGALDVLWAIRNYIKENEK